MFSGPSNLKRRLAVICAAVAVAQGVGAQQPIIFSKPAGDVADKANAFIPPSSLHGAAGAFNAPASPFGGGQPAVSFDVLPGMQAPSPVSPEQAQRWQKLLDDKKNWTLLTPAEIYGVTTSEKIFGLADPKNEDKLSATERYLLRQSRASSSSATNGRPNAALLREDSPDNPFRRQNGNDRLFHSGDKPEPGSPKYFNQLLSIAPNSPFGAEPKAESVWTSPFSPPAPVAKPDLAQEAAMERFRTLMDPGALPDKPATAPRLAPLPAPDPNMQPLPLGNRLGQSFTPLQSGISKPTGIMPLPSITSPYALPVTAKPDGQAQRPPWLSDSPQPFGNLPRRAF
jgi:hypothetical protein